MPLPWHLEFRVILPPKFTACVVTRLKNSWKNMVPTDLMERLTVPMGHTTNHTLRAVVLLECITNQLCVFVQDASKFTTALRMVPAVEKQYMDLTDHMVLCIVHTVPMVVIMKCTARTDHMVRKAITSKKKSSTNVFAIAECELSILRMVHTDHMEPNTVHMVRTAVTEFPPLAARI